MRQFHATLLLTLLSFAAGAQSLLTGQVIDDKGKPVPSASVSLDNTLDGTTADSAGRFSFTTEEKGTQGLVAAGIGYESVTQAITLPGNHEGLVIRLKKVATDLEGVTVTAGAFEASPDKAKTILSTMDILTTAGTNADVVQAIQTLPGTQKAGTSTGLFVRGGDASEAAIVVDGLIAQNGFFPSAPGVATRSRFTPFQFKGVSFSSGGYSARYGQALSSVLELNTLDLADKTTLNLGANMAGIYASGSKLWKKSSGGATAFYNNLTPFYKLANTNFDFYAPPKGGGGSANYVWTPTAKSILKVLLNGQQFNSGTEVYNPANPGSALRFGIVNTNGYATVSYRNFISSKWQVYAAASASFNKDDVSYDGTPSLSKDNREQVRLEAKRYLGSHFSLTGGAEVQHFTYDRSFDTLSTGFTENSTAGYAEGEWSPARWIAIKPGLRYEHSQLLGQGALAPRLALALRTGKWSQVSLAGGYFYQTADNAYLLNGYRPDFQKAAHYIANYQWIKGDRTFRIEGYYKDYSNLVREKVTYYDPNAFRFVYTAVDNSGYGYATGAELFWRDKNLVKNLDYWISYSYIDTRRLYKNFLAEATPDFISNHNLNLISKYWIQKWSTQINMTYSYASGRPYYNPNNTSDGFLKDRTPDYHNLSFTVNYLTSVGKWFTVIYAGVDNATNQKNVFGYRYSADGKARYPQYPALFRSFFVGVNFSLTEFNKDEL